MFLLKKYSKFAGTVSAVLLATTLTACFSSGSSSTSATTAVAASLAVTSTAPVLNATEVGTNVKVVAVFNNAIKSQTLTDTSFTLKGADEMAIPYTVSYDAKTMTAILKPTDLLSSKVAYTATLTTAVQDENSSALAKNYAWTFTTAESTDSTAPQVESFDPTDGKTGVVLNTKVTVVFDEAIDPATLTAESFKLTRGTSTVTSTLGYVDPTTVVLTLDNDLEKETNYTLTLNNKITDIAGNSLALVTVGFKTGTERSMGPKAVELGTAGNFVVLAKSAISTTGTTAITGDIGVSPAAETFITGFSQERDSTNTFSTAVAIVTGKIYASDMAVPTPANMTTAISDMEIAYTDAAGRSNPDFTELGAGDISGKTLEPGLYKWGTGLLITSDITLEGGANDVWILQIAEDLTIGNGVKVTLAGDAQPKNIFWQVAGAATMGTTSDVKGIILSKTRIEMNTDAVLNGRALAQTAVTLDANAVTQPAQ